MGACAPTDRASTARRSLSPPPTLHRRPVTTSRTGSTALRHRAPVAGSRHVRDRQQPLAATPASRCWSSVRWVRTPTTCTLLFHGRHPARRARPRRAGHRRRRGPSSHRAHRRRRGAARVPHRAVGATGVPRGLPRGCGPRPGSRAARGEGHRPAQASAIHASQRPRDQQRPIASARSADWSNTARPRMLWPKARRSPRVGIAGATPTPSADTHATVRPAAASSRRCRKRRRLSSGSAERPRRGDDGQGVRGHAGEGVGQQLDGVTSQQQRRGRRRQRDLRVEPRGPLGLIRRQAGAQPAGVVGVGHVDRIAVDADPGDDLGHRPRRDGPVSHDRGRQPHGDDGSPRIGRRRR